MRPLYRVSSAHRCQELPHRFHQVVHPAGLADDAVALRREERLQVLALAVGRVDEDRKSGSVLANPLQDVEPRPFLHQEVGEKEVVSLLLEAPQGLVSAGGRIHAVAGLLTRPGDPRPLFRVVFDNQDFRHQTSFKRCPSLKSRSIPYHNTRPPPDAFGSCGGARRGSSMTLRKASVYPEVSQNVTALG